MKWFLKTISSWQVTSKSWLPWPQSICVVQQYRWDAWKRPGSSPVLRKALPSKGCVGNPATVPLLLRGSCYVAVGLYSSLSLVRNEGLDCETRSEKGLRGGCCFSALAVRVLSENCNFGAQFSEFQIVKSLGFIEERLETHGDVLLNPLCWPTQWVASW